MGRIWRGLKLGMKSLLLAQAPVGPDGAGHRLRRGGGDLDAGDRRGDQPRRPGADRALGATNIIVRSVKPSDEAQATGGRPAHDPQLRSQVQRLRPDPRDDAHDPQGPADPRDPQADPPRPLRHRRPRGRHDARLCRVQPAPDREGPVPDGLGQREIPELRRARRRDRQDPLPLRGPAQPVGQARHRLLHRRRRDRGASQLGRDRRQPGGPGLQQGRVHPAQYLQAPVRREDHRQPLGLDGRPRRPSSPRSPFRSASIDEVLPTVPADRGRVRALPPQERRRDDRPLRPAARRRRARPASSASSWARSRRSRCWSAASAS